MKEIYQYILLLLCNYSQDCIRVVLIIVWFAWLRWYTVSATVILLWLMKFAKCTHLYPIPDEWALIIVLFKYSHYYTLKIMWMGLNSNGFFCVNLHSSVFQNNQKPFTQPSLRVPEGRLKCNLNRVNIGNLPYKCNVNRVNTTHVTQCQCTRNFKRMPASALPM